MSSSKGENGSGGNIFVDSFVFVLKSLLTILVLSCWTVIGFLLWVPYWTRLLVWLTGITLLSVFQKINTDRIEAALRSAVAFYPEKFRTLCESIWSSSVKGESVSEHVNVKWLSLILVIVPYVLWAIFFWGLLLVLMRPYLPSRLRIPDVQFGEVFMQSSNNESKPKQKIGLTVAEKESKWLDETRKSVTGDGIDHKRFWGAIGELRELGSLDKVSEERELIRSVLDTCEEKVDQGYGFLNSRKELIDQYRATCDKVFDLLLELRAQWACEKLLDIQSKRGYLYAKSKSTISLLCSPPDSL